MLIALTGATGFIGSYTAAALHRSGHAVRALVRRTSRRDSAAPYVSEWTIGELDDPQALAGLVAGAEVVIHLAADWNALETSPIRNFERNVLASLRLLEAARLAGARQFLFASSIAVYHDILSDRRLDEFHPTLPHSLYGAYKAAVEPHLVAYHHQFGMNTSSWRPGGVYGIDPRLQESQWYKIVQQVKRGEDVDTASGGKVVHVQDVADALAAAIDDPEVSGKCFNLVDCYVYDQTVAEIARDLCGSSSRIASRKGEGPRHQFNTALARGFFTRHGNTVALQRGEPGIRGYIEQLLKRV